MIFKKQFFIKTILVFIILVFSTGCVVSRDPAAEKIAMDKLKKENRIKNKQIYLSMGERTFDVNEITLMKALVSAFNNKNIAVKNIDKDIGFLSAEGRGFLSPEKQKEISIRKLAKLNKISNKNGYTWHNTPGNNIKMFSANFFSKGKNRTTVKVGVSQTVFGNASSTNHEMNPETLAAIYEELWRELDKSLFLLHTTQ